MGSVTENMKKSLTLGQGKVDFRWWMMHTSEVRLYCFSTCSRSSYSFKTRSKIMQMTLLFDIDWETAGQLRSYWIVSCIIRATELIVNRCVCNYSIRWTKKLRNLLFSRTEWQVSGNSRTCILKKLLLTTKVLKSLSTRLNVAMNILSLERRP